jgi:Zn-dependent protease/predicted transcriptional regulator
MYMMFLNLLGSTSKKRTSKTRTTRKRSNVSSDNHKLSNSTFKNRTILSLQVAKIRGIPIRLHFTLVIAFFLISWTVSAYLMPEIYPGLSPAEYWTIGIIGAIILFISVLLHELAHSIIALKYGINVNQIILFVFGGVSDIEETPQEDSSKDFRKELKIAIVGPITSFIIAGILGLSWLILSSLIVSSGSNNNSPTGLIVVGAAAVVSQSNNYMLTLITITNIARGVLLYGMLVNILLGAFNLIPAFPLDGGRILRSALLRWKKDYDQATKISAKIGIAISYGFMAFGFLIMFSGSFTSGIWILLIGWFLNSGAQSYLQQHEITSILSTVRLSEIMNTNIISVREDLAIYNLIKDYFNPYAKDSFPVVNEAGYLLGMVAFKDAWNIPESKKQIVKAKDIMIPKANLIVITDPTRKADNILMQMSRKRMGKAFVCNEQGRLIGILSKTDIMNIVSERKEYSQAFRKLNR